jgi:DNA gyrase subunit A
MATAKTPAKAAAKGKKPAGPKPGEYPGKIVDIDVS